jgi:hypothetical protein
MSQEVHFILIKGTIDPEEVTIVNICAPNISALRFIKQIVLYLKAPTDANTMTVMDFNIQLTKDRSFKQTKINKETLELNDTTHPMNSTDIYRALNTPLVGKTASSTNGAGKLATYMQKTGTRLYQRSSCKTQNIETTTGKWENSGRFL